MKKVLFGLIIISSFSTFACECFKGVEENLRERETKIISSHLEVSEAQIVSTKMLSIKKRDNIANIVGKVVFLPAYAIGMAANKCNRVCLRRDMSNIRGVAKYLVGYNTDTGTYCERVIKVKGVTNYEGTKLKKIKTQNLGETCN